jgi:Domain of unknown function (DUF5753)
VAASQLQTEDYARTNLGVEPGADKDKLDEQVTARIDRQAILERADGPQLWCVLDETVLYRPIGGAKVMRGQLDHLARLADEPKTTVQIIPAPVGAHAGLLGAFILADLDDHTWLYLETSAEGQLSENKSLISGVVYRFEGAGGAGARGGAGEGEVAWQMGLGGPGGAGGVGGAEGSDGRVRLVGLKVLVGQVRYMGLKVLIGGWGW